ncbi:MAG: hypothetical protein WB441_05575 [Nocardioidaceae bacterium]
MNGPRVTVLAVRPPVGKTTVLVPDLVASLRLRGCRVEVMSPDEGWVDLSALEPAADVYVLKSGTETALSYAGALHAAGAHVVNPYPVAAACRDKIVQTRVLAAAGVPVPQSWLTAEPLSLLPELAGGPLILKDPRGSQGRGLAVVRTPAELAAVAVGRPWLAMRYHEPEGQDLKLYRIGEEVFGVERMFPARTYQDKLGRPFDVPARLREVVMRCGDSFGISIYGVDVIRSKGCEWVVDMSAFPGFKGVPQAGARVAEQVLAEVRAGTDPVLVAEKGVAS